MNKIVLIASLIATTACGNSLSETRIHNGLYDKSEEHVERDAFGNMTKVVVDDERDPYQYCLATHKSAKWMCDQNTYNAGNGYGGYPLAAPGPNAWTGAGSLIGGYGWANAEAVAQQAQGSAPANGSGVPRSEYEQDKTKTESRFRGLYKQVKKDHDAIVDLQSEGEPSGK